MKRKFFFLPIIFLSVAFAQNSGGVKFRFKYQKGDTYRILSTVNEDVYFNRVKNHSSVIVNRVTAEVTETTEDGSGIHDCIFMTTEDSTGDWSGANFSWGEEYRSIFKRDKFGVYEISDEYFMPTVRDVPIFPDREIFPGETWTAKGHEAHDLRQGFGIEKPYKVPFNAEYTFRGKDEKTGLYEINVRYTLYMESPRQNSAGEWPLVTQGFSDETIWWDNERGAIDHYNETFRIFIESSAGNLFEFTGSAKAEVTDFVRTNTSENLQRVEKKVRDLGLKNVTVKPGEKGLTISIENIQFEPDSAVLMESEKSKLREISKILNEYPNDILVTGHTALAGSEKMRQILSEERASSVADFFVQNGVRDRYHIFTQGFGAKIPVAPNNTEEGKARNRRVEITILDK